MSPGAGRVAGLLAGLSIAVLVWPVAAQKEAAMRVVDRVAGAELSVDALVARMADADVWLIGVAFGAATPPSVPVELFAALASRRPGVTLVFETFERDVQEPFDHFQMGHMPEAEFLAAARPAPEYAHAYKPIVDFAIAREWSMMAANVPRRITAAVAQSGLVALDSLAMGDRQLAAADHACAADRPFPPSATRGPHAAAAWCLENETIAESIAQAHAAGRVGGRRPFVVGLVQGSRLGHLAPLAGDVLKRLPGRAIAQIAVVPVSDLRGVESAANDLAIPRYVAYVRSAPQGSPQR
jgi:hypothetical protein